MGIANRGGAESEFPIEDLDPLIDDFASRTGDGDSLALKADPTHVDGDVLAAGMNQDLDRSAGSID